MFRTFLISLYVFFSNTYIKEWPFSGLFFCGVWWKTCCMYAVPFSFQEIELYCRECQLEQAFFHNYQAYTLHLLYFNSICNKGQIKIVLSNGILNSDLHYGISSSNNKTSVPPSSLLKTMVLEFKLMCGSGVAHVSCRSLIKGQQVR